MDIGHTKNDLIDADEERLRTASYRGGPRGCAVTAGRKKTVTLATGAPYVTTVTAVMDE
jgi:hypothetical protein